MRNAGCRGESGFDGLTEEISACADKAGLIGEDGSFFDAIGRFPLGAFLSLEAPLIAHLDNGPIVLQYAQRSGTIRRRSSSPARSKQQICNGLGLGANPMVIRFWRDTAKHVDQHEDTGFQLVRIVASAQSFDTVSRLAGKKPGIVSLVGKTAVKEIDRDGVSQRLLAIRLCGIQSRAQLAPQGSSKSGAVKLAKDALPDPPSAWKKWPVEYGLAVVLARVGQTATANVPTDFAGIGAKHCSYWLFGACFLAKHRLAYDGVDVSLAQSNLHREPVE